MLNNNLHLILSPNLSTSTTSPVPNNPSEECLIELAKEEYKTVGDHKLLKKTLICITYSEYCQLKLMTETVGSFLNFIKAHDAERTHSTSDEGKEGSTNETSGNA